MTIERWEEEEIKNERESRGRESERFSRSVLCHLSLISPCRHAHTRQRLSHFLVSHLSRFRTGWLVSPTPMTMHVAGLCSLVYGLRHDGDLGLFGLVGSPKFPRTETMRELRSKK